MNVALMSDYIIIVMIEDLPSDLEIMQFGGFIGKHNAEVVEQKRDGLQQGKFLSHLSFRAEHFELSKLESYLQVRRQGSISDALHKLPSTQSSSVVHSEPSMHIFLYHQRKVVKEKSAAIL